MDKPPPQEPFMHPSIAWTIIIVGAAALVAAGFLFRVGWRFAGG